jgi:hypothetical protein
LQNDIVVWGGISYYVNVTNLYRRWSKESERFTCTESPAAYAYAMRLKPFRIIDGFVILLVGAFIFCVFTAVFPSFAEIKRTYVSASHDPSFLLFAAVFLMFVALSTYKSRFPRTRFHRLYDSWALINRPAGKRRLVSFAVKEVQSMEVSGANYRSENFSIITVHFKSVLGKWYLGRRVDLEFCISGPNDLANLTQWGHDCGIEMKTKI